MSTQPTLHLIGNAHLDPVWLWDWREGLNEGISTCRTMVELLRAFPAARFIRGEAAIYEHIERHDPPLFAAIRRLVAAGRWDVVGGTYVQTDDNLPATESLLRQFVAGKRYFRRKFGVEVTAAWSADCFGHAAGLPEILAAAGMESFAFTRPSGEIPGLDKPAFWWRAGSGARILCYRPLSGWYGTERDEMERRLDAMLAEAQRCGLENVGCFYGLGNHGGGPSREQLRQIDAWAARHPEVRVEHSGLHRLFAALRDEAGRKAGDWLPEFSGELNFCLRGCSASVAKFKFQYRRAEAQLLRAERTLALAATARGRASAPLDEPWRALLFNAFHDLLPGTSIERAFDDQLAQLGGVFSEAQRAENDALLDLMREVDTRPQGWSVPDSQPQPVALLVWNSHPWPVETLVELEAPLDYRPLWQYQNRHADVSVRVTDAAGAPLPAQRTAEEHDSMGDLPWRRRMLVPLTLAPCGWQIVHMGLGDGGVPPRTGGATVIDDQTITNDLVQIGAKIGAERVIFQRDGRPWLGEGLAVRVYADEWGSWGGMKEEPDSWQLNRERERWKIDAVRVLEGGPERASLWVRFQGARSRLELTFLLTRDRRDIQVRARVLWNERCARLKLVLPAGGAAEFEVPGGTVRRMPCGEVPGGRWVRVDAADTRVGFASDALYGFDVTTDELRATVVRATRYASDVTSSPDDRPWLPAVDAGELRFLFLLTDDLDQLPRLAAELEAPPVISPVPTRRGKRPAVGSLAEGLPPAWRLLALRGLAAELVELRIQNTGPTCSGSIQWLGEQVELGPVDAGIIATWQLTRSATGWRAVRVAATASSVPGAGRAAARGAV